MPMVLVVAALATGGLMVMARVRSSLSRRAVSQARPVPSSARRMARAMPLTRGTVTDLLPTFPRLVVKVTMVLSGICPLTGSWKFPWLS